MRANTAAEMISSRLLHSVSKHVLEDQRVDLWVGDPACMHNEPNTLFISVKELVSRVIRNVDTFITAEIARIKSWTQRKQSKRMQR